MATFRLGALRIENFGSWVCVAVPDVESVSPSSSAVGGRRAGAVETFRGAGVWCLPAWACLVRCSPRSDYAHLWND
jgi:hypothetical protein